MSIVAFINMYYSIIPLIVYEKVILFRRIHPILTEYLFLLILNIQQTSCRDKTVGPQFGEGQKEKRRKLKNQTVGRGGR